MAVNDIWMLTDFQTFFSQQMENVFFYRQTASDVNFPSGKALVDMWNSQVRIPTTNFQNPALVHTRYQAMNLFNPAEFYDVIDNDPGAFVGSALAPFFAAGFGAPRINAVIRASKRRLPGLSEEQLAGVTLTGASLTLANNIATAYNATLANVPVGGSNLFVPVAVKRIEYTTPAGTKAYRLPENIGEAVYRVITNWSYERITTQNSRKIGKGV